MRSFWLILLLLVGIAGLVFFLRPRETEEERIRRETEAMLDHAAVASKSDPTPAVTMTEKRPGEPAASSTQPTTAPAASGPTSNPDVSVASSAAATNGSAPTASQPAASTPADASSGDGLNVTIVHADVQPGKVVRNADGTIRVDDRFTLVGDGTREHPYKLTWEYLISASETYQPRLGQMQMPQRIALLHQKWVSIEGNIAFPLAATSPREILAMLNMWDGCCIGVPPTPYDAIEVNLAEPVPGTKRHTMTYGTVTGRLKVEPYLIESWLAGIYVMDEASLEQGL